MRKAMCERLALDIREVCDFAPDGIRPGEVLALMEAEIDGIDPIIQILSAPLPMALSVSLKDKRILESLVLFNELIP